MAQNRGRDAARAPTSAAAHPDHRAKAWPKGLAPVEHVGDIQVGRVHHHYQLTLVTGAATVDWKEQGREVFLDPNPVLLWVKWIISISETAVGDNLNESGLKGTGMDDSRKFFAIGCLGLLYLSLNGVLWVVQTVANRDEQREIDAIVADLGVLEGELVSLEAQLDQKVESMEQQQVLVEDCTQKMEAFQQIAVDGVLPAREFERYEELRTTCKPQLSKFEDGYEAFVRQHEQYLAAATSYNQKVDRHNRLAEETALFLLIPVPRSMRGKNLMARVVQAGERYAAMQE